MVKVPIQNLLIFDLANLTWSSENQYISAPSAGNKEQSCEKHRSLMCFQLL